MCEQIDRQTGDKTAIALWYGQIKAASDKPWLASLLLRRARGFRQRLAYFYDRLASLPRGWRRRIQRGLAAGLLGAALLLAMGRTPSIHAATITVGGDCSLAEAIVNANDLTTGQPNPDCAAGNPAGADTIVLTGGTYTYSAEYGTGSRSALPGISSEITIEGNGSTISRTGTSDEFRILGVGPGGDLTLNAVTISGGDTSLGGGLFNRGTLTLNDSSVSSNAARAGGGILNLGSLTVNRSTVSGNSAMKGGGIAAGYDEYLYNVNTTLNDSTVSGNTATSWGGGVYNYAKYSGSELTLNSSTVSGNSATFRGGGIANSSSFYGTVIMTLNDSTVSGNTAQSGGGILNAQSFYGWARMSLNNSTVTGNSADTGGGIFNQEYYYDSTELNMNQSLVSGNSASTGQEISNGATINANAHNLFGHSSQTNAAAFNGFTPGAADISATSDGTNPTALNNILDTSLANNGGATLTHALVSGSPAVDASPTGEPVDQRGVARPLDGDGISGAAYDIGAVELGAVICGIQAASEPATYNFGDMSVEITDDGSNLDCIRSTNFPQNHPDAVAGTDTGQYWDIDGLQADKIAPATVNYIFNLTLPHSVSMPDDATVCKFKEDSGWACSQTGADDTTVWLDDIVDGFSDWAAGDNAPTAVSLLSFEAEANPGSAGILAALLAGVTAVFLGMRRAIRR